MRRDEADADTVMGDGSRYLDMPALGALAAPDSRSTTFRVWAPFEPELRLRVHGSGAAGEVRQGDCVSLEDEGDGYRIAVVEGAVPGTRYRYVTGDGRELADPASHSQPSGVHGPSEVFDPGAFNWTDAAFAAPEPWSWIIYEIHVGTFSAAGTLDGAVTNLEHLVELGVSAVELMPACQFPGRRNWGYDGVFPFAIHDSYGGPGALQRFVNAAHQFDLAVILDVVYNHLGPEGNVFPDYGPYFTDRYHTPWGEAVNFDGPESDHVRRYFVQNALGWRTDFHIDALRLDAVHEIVDTTARTFLLELHEATRELGRRTGRRFPLIAESADNDPKVVSDPALGGTGMDAQWNDDFHHALHSVVTGERNGYYVDFGLLEQLGTSISEGFVLQGGYSRHRRRRHGAPSSGIEPERLVTFAQNHDQIGNRPRGDRLACLLSADHLRLVCAVLMTSPYVPLLFMGEEYAETAPFPYFVDHTERELLEAVRRGRAYEMRDLGFEEEQLDPADSATFELAKVDFGLREVGHHVSVWTAYRELIRLRRTHPALARSSRSGCRAHVSNDSLLGVYRKAHDSPDEAVAFFNFGAAATPIAIPVSSGHSWVKLADSATPRFGGSGTGLLPDRIEDGGTLTIAPTGFCVYGA
jgi:maltooligosyltrehalose trehalohydrolase